MPRKSLVLSCIFAIVFLYALPVFAADSNCRATLTEDLKIHIPCFILGADVFWIDLDYVDDPQYWLWKLTDAGYGPAVQTGKASWGYNDFGTPSEFAGTAVLSESEVIAGTGGYYGYLNSGTIYRSSDAGKNWTKTNIENVANISKIEFSQDINGYTGVGYATGGAEGYGFEGFIGRTTDGGKTWTDITEAFNTGRQYILNPAFNPNTDTAYYFPLYGLSVLDDDTFYVAGQGGSGPAEIYKSSDRGASWFGAGRISLGVGGENTIYYPSFRMFSASKGIIASNKKLYRTSDGGNNWQGFPVPWDASNNSDDELGSLSFVDSDNGFALVVDEWGSAESPTFGSRLYRTSNGGGTWSLVKEWTDPNSPFPLVAFAGSGSELWAGAWEKIWHSTDGGVSWTLEYDKSSYVRARGFQVVPGANQPVVLYSVGSQGSYIAGFYKNSGTFEQDSCAATFSSDGTLHIPCLFYGSSSLWADFLYVSYELAPNDLIFALSPHYGSN